ncbi:MAG: thiolase domain-containing protein, partial [Chloroflexota bacterium]
MSIKGKAFIVGAYEHPERRLPDKSVAQIHAEVALGALADAGLSLKDVDGFFSDAAGMGLGALSLADYLGLKLSIMDSTDTGGSSYLCHVGHAATAIAEGKCHVALVTLAGKGRSAGGRGVSEAPEVGFEAPYG